MEYVKKVLRRHYKLYFLYFITKGFVFMFYSFPNHVLTFVLSTVGGIKMNETQLLLTDTYTNKYNARNNCHRRSKRKYIGSSE